MKDKKRPSKRSRNQIIALLLVGIFSLAVFIPVLTAVRNRGEKEDVPATTRSAMTAESKESSVIESAKTACAKKGLKVYYPKDESLWEFRKIEDEKNLYFVNTLVGIDDYDNEYELCCIFSNEESPIPHYVYVGGKVVFNDQKYNSELSREKLPVK